MCTKTNIASAMARADLAPRRQRGVGLHCLSRRGPVLQKRGDAAIMTFPA